MRRRNNAAYMRIPPEAGRAGRPDIGRERRPALADPDADRDRTPARDIVVERGNFTFYFLVVTSLLVSVLFTLVLWMLRR